MLEEIRSITVRKERSWIRNSCLRHNLPRAMCELQTSSNKFQENCLKASRLAKRENISGFCIRHSCSSKRNDDLIHRDSDCILCNDEILEICKSYMFCNENGTRNCLWFHLSANLCFMNMVAEIILQDWFSMKFQDLWIWQWSSWNIQVSSLIKW